LLHSLARMGSRFTRLWIAQSVSELGTGLHLVAFPLLATTMTSDPRLIAALAMVSGAPGLLLALPVGVWVDRSHRGRLMAGSDLTCALLIALLLVAWSLGALHLWVLFVLATGLGIAELVFGTSTFALLPSLVAEPDLLRANSFLSVSREVGAGVLGPALGGLAFAVTPLLPFALNGASYLVSSLIIGSFAWRGTTRAPRVLTTAADGLTRQDQAWRTELTAGLSYLRRHKAARTTLVLSATAGLFGWMPEATFVLFAKDELRVSTSGFGLLLGVTTVGAVVGGIVVGKFADRINTVVLLQVTYLTYGLLLIPIAFLSSPWIASGVFFVQGLPLIACDTASRSLLQQIVPPDLLGRVGAVNRLVGSAVIPISLFAGGMLGHWLGLRAVWAIAGGGFLAAFALNLPGIRALSRDWSTDSRHKT